MSAHRLLGILLCAALLPGCAGLSHRDRAQVAAIVETAHQASTVECTRADNCAATSVFAGSAVQAGRGENAREGNSALLLEAGSDALLARLHMIRSARHSIDLQTYIYKEDDAGRVVLRELLAAARRGVRVRLLVDQLSAMESAQTLAALAGVHRGFELRIYSPLFHRARLKTHHYVLASLFHFRQLNRRMHTKLLLVDGQVAVTGGRNYQDDYYDWSPSYNFLDRDILVVGPVAARMGANFEQFWQARRSVPVAQLADVAHVLLREGVPALPARRYEVPERVRTMQAAASDMHLLQQRLGARLTPVAAADFVADPPRKHRGDPASLPPSVMPSSLILREALSHARQEVMLQTPYLVLSHAAQRLFATLHAQAAPPRVVVSTNSLAATDNVLTWAMGYKYRRRYVQRFGFELYELKPFPQDVPLEPWLDETGPPSTLGPIAWMHANQSRGEALSGRGVLLHRNSPAPLTREATQRGPRAGLHAKSLVIDRETAIVGTHNFDPRSDRFNTESALIVRDAAFATQLARNIERATLPANAWTVAPRDWRLPLDETVVAAAEQLPVFDLWPTRYATAYEFQPGPDCPTPLRYREAAFSRCYRAVGDFPGVRVIGMRWWLTRLVTGFGAGMAPYL